MLLQTSILPNVCKTLPATRKQHSGIAEDRYPVLKELGSSFHMYVPILPDTVPVLHQVQLSCTAHVHVPDKSIYQPSRKTRKTTSIQLNLGNATNDPIPFHPHHTSIRPSTHPLFSRNCRIVINDRLIMPAHRTRLAFRTRIMQNLTVLVEPAVIRLVLGAEESALDEPVGGGVTADVGVVDCEAHLFGGLFGIWLGCW